MKNIVISLYFILLLTGVAVGQTIKGNFAIKNVQTGLLLRIKDANPKNGTPLVAYSPQNWKCMTWNFISADSNTYQLKNLFSGKTFQQKREGMALEEQPLVAGSKTQQYLFERAGKDTYYIRLSGTTLYLVPEDVQGSSDSAIILAKKSPSKAFTWTIYEQAPTM